MALPVDKVVLGRSHTGDWEVLYHNGRALIQSNHISLHEAFKLILEYAYDDNRIEFVIKTAWMDVIDKAGGFPDLYDPEMFIERD